LGHVILHPCVNTVFLDVYTYVVIEKIENEANILAAELLITDEDINVKSIKKQKNYKPAISITKMDMFLSQLPEIS